MKQGRCTDVCPITSAHHGPRCCKSCVLSQAQRWTHLRCISRWERAWAGHQKPWCIMGKPGTVKHTTDILSFTVQTWGALSAIIAGGNLFWTHTCGNTCTHQLFFVLLGSNYTNEGVIFISKKNYLIGENAAHICVIPRLNYGMWRNN